MAENSPEAAYSNRLFLLNGEQNDGNITVLVSGDKMELKADFYPPAENAKPIDLGSVNDALTGLNIVHGLQWETVENAVAICNLERRLLRDITIARGDPPVTEILAYFQLNPNLKTPSEDAADTVDCMRRVHTPPACGGVVDYRARSPFIIVKKGQALARLKPRKEGNNGRNIYGEIIPNETLTPEGVSGGTNTYDDGKFIYSGINGQLVFDKKILNVQESLVIKGGVDYHTGHIVFPGDVTIEGTVSDGFKIYSGGSVTIKQTLDVTELTAKTDLIVAGGIIGRGRGMLKVGGGLKAKFIENCRAACRKGVKIESDIINSSVYTLEDLAMGDKGKIVGGEIYAVKGVRAAAIGKKGGRSTRIHCGVDFTALQEREQCNYRLRIVSAKLAKLRELLAGESSESPEQLAKINEALGKLEEEQKKLTGQSAAVMGKINAYEGAVVEVNGEIAAGTLIEICQIALFVADPLHTVRIRLDRAVGKLVHEPIT